MIAYFKYTNGTAFNFGSSSYNGMINVRDGVAYTGAVYNESSKRLNNKSNYIAEIYLNKINFNRTVGDSLVLNEKDATVYSRTILSEFKLIEGILNKLNYNNLLLYSKTINYNSDIFNTYAKTIDAQPTMYCATRTDPSFRGRILAKDLTGLPGALSSVTSVSPDSSLFAVLSNNTFFQYHNNGRRVIAPILSGSVATIDDSIITNNDPTSFDRYNKLLYITSLTSSSKYYLELGLSTTFLSGGTLSGGKIGLLDRADITRNNIITNRSLVTYGKTYRCAIVSNNGRQLIEVSRVDNSAQLFSITLSDLNCDSIISICQRFEDHALGMIVLRGTQFYFRMFDLDVLYQTNVEKAQGFDFIPIEGQIASYLPMNNMTFYDAIEFAPFDSDVVIIRTYTTTDNLEKIEFRSVTNPLLPMCVFGDIGRSGYVEAYSPVISGIETLINYMDSTFSAPDVTVPFKDVQFDVTDKVYYLTLYPNMLEVGPCNLYNNFTSFNLPKKYKPIDNNKGSSIGLVLNNYLRYLIHDTFNLHKAVRSAPVSFSNGAIYGTDFSILGDISDDNFYIYENETLNVASLNRIFTGIVRLQKNIARAIRVTV
jgi:hypothetical protein